MWRMLIVIGLTVATVASAEARSLRFSFRPRGFAASRSFLPPVERQMPPRIAIFHKDGATAAPAPVASILDAPGQVARPTLVAPVSPAQKAELAKKTADQSAHWCDHGKVIGSGTGFCVLDAGSGAPS